MKPRNRKEARLSREFQHVRALGKDESQYRKQARRFETAMRKASRQVDRKAIRDGLNE